MNSIFYYYAPPSAKDSTSSGLFVLGGKKGYRDFSERTLTAAKVFDILKIGENYGEIQYRDRLEDGRGVHYRRRIYPHQRVVALSCQSRKKRVLRRTHAKGLVQELGQTEIRRRTQGRFHNYRHRKSKIRLQYETRKDDGHNAVRRQKDLVFRQRKPQRDEKDFGLLRRSRPSRQRRDVKKRRRRDGRRKVAYPAQRPHSAERKMFG